MGCPQTDQLFYNNILKTNGKFMVKCSDLFTAMNKILEERAKTPHEPPVHEETAVEEQPPAPFQFNFSPSKSGESLVS